MTKEKLNQTLTTHNRTTNHNALQPEYAHKHVGDCVADLSLNINPLGPSPTCLTFIHEQSATANTSQLSKLLSSYPFTNERLIALIASHHGVSRDQIVLTDGCDGALRLICQALMKKEDMAFIPLPTFHRYAFHARNTWRTSVYC